MSEITQVIETGPFEEHPAHPGAGAYVIVAVALCILTALEVTVAYLPALRPVMIPVLIILAIAKFALIAMFFMHLHYDSRLLSTFFLGGLLAAFVLFIALLFLFVYLDRHRAIIM